MRASCREYQPVDVPQKMRQVPLTMNKKKTIPNQELERYLRVPLADLRLSDSERQALRGLGEELDIEQARFMRNRAFDLVREQLNNAPDTLQPTLK